MIKKGDKVIVLAGKDRKKSGEVTKVFPTTSMAIVSGVNIKKRHRRATKAGGKGTIVDLEFPIHISNLKLDKQHEK